MLLLSSLCLPSLGLVPAPVEMDRAHPSLRLHSSLPGPGCAQSAMVLHPPGIARANLLPLACQSLLPAMGWGLHSLQETPVRPALRLQESR